MPLSAPRLPALTSIRFFLAVPVVLVHVHPRGWDVRWASNWLVQAFFLFSGFVTVLNYRHGSTRRFLTNRFARIYPLYLLAWTLVLIGNLAKHRPMSFADGAITLLLVQAWFTVYAVAWNPPGWSLSCEAFFYLVAPAAMPPADTARMSRTRELVATIACIAIFVGSSFLLPIVCPNLVRDTSSMHSVPEVMRSLSLWGMSPIHSPLFSLPVFVGAMFLGRYYLVRNVEGDRYAWIFTVLGVLGIAVAFVLLPRRYEIPFYHHILPRAALVPPLVLLTYGLACDSTSIIARFMALKPLVYLGELSYAIYILHFPLGYLPLPHDGLTGMLFFLALSVGVSAFVYQVYEQPLRRILRRWTK